MAVKIDIPDIGEVVAENAASEATLLEILDAINEATGKGGKKSKEKEAADKALKANTKIIQDNSVGWAAAGKGAVDALKTFALTAVSMATKFAVNYAEIATDPIRATADSLNQLIDATASVATSLTDAIPFIGKFVSALINAGAEILKAGNDVFATQLKKNLDSLQTFAKAGVAFSGGMTEMGQVAHAAGLDLTSFSKLVVENKNEMMMLGLSGADASTKLSTAMGFAASSVKKGGLTLRDEMFKMGYNYEEQGGLFTSFMANMQAAGKLRAMTDREIAEGTRKYAADLKVVADFTGQDAKKLADRARQQQLMVVAQQKLSADERERLGQATQMLSRMGPEGEKAIQALTQKLVLGATNMTQYAMGPGKDLIDSVTSNVKSGAVDMFESTGKAMAKAQEATNASSMSGAVGVASLFNAAGEAGQALNEFAVGINLNGKITAESIAQMRKYINDQATKKDLVGDNVAKLYDETKKHQVEMEQMVNKELGQYAKNLSEINRLTQGNFMKFLRYINNGEKTDVQVTGEQFLKDLNPFNAENWKVKKPDPAKAIEREPKESDEDYRSRVRKLEASKNFLPMFDKGGSIPAGTVGMAGEKGPEIIAGPAEVLSTKSTEKLMKSVDMLASVKDTQTTQNNSASTAKLDEMISQLMELVRLMRDNVNHTARVAQNTN
jgi:hypothetical protein